MESCLRAEETLDTCLTYVLVFYRNLTREGAAQILEKIAERWRKEAEKPIGRERSQGSRKDFPACR